MVSNGIDVGEYIYGQVPDHPTVTVMDLTVPDGIIAHKYCYTADKGFYLNPAYVSPICADDFKILQQTVKNTQTAFAAQLGV